MEIHERAVGNVTVVDVTGNLVADSDSRLKDKVRSLVQQGQSRIVIDLAKVPYMDSSGLGELISVYTSTKNAGGALKLTGVTTRLHDLLTITKLVTVFDTYDDQESAIASFGA